MALSKEDTRNIKSKLPECEPITCSKPKPPENGGVSATGIKSRKSYYDSPNITFFPN